MTVVGPVPQPLQAPLDPRPIGWRVGLVVLASDPTIENSFQRMLAGTDQVAIHANRIEFDGDISVRSLKTMEARIAAAAAGILPDQQIDAVLYGCTSASAAIGDDRVRALLLQGKPGTASAETPVSGALAAFRAVGARRLSVLAPYPADVTAMLADYLGRLGHEVVALACLGLKIDWENGQVPLDWMRETVCAMDHKDAEAIFLSCTALRGAEVAQSIEDRLGLPVITSNQALLWHGLRQAGCDLKISGFGRLMQM